MSIDICDVKQLDDIVTSIEQSGCVLVKNALPGAKIYAYAEKIKKFFAYMDSKIGTYSADDDSYGAVIVKGLKAQGGFPLSMLMDDHFETPVGFRQIYLMIQQSGLMKAARNVLGGDVGFMLDYCSARRQTPQATEKYLPLHQDASPVCLPLHWPGLVFWVPLTDIDAETPSLDVVPRKMQQIFAHVSDPETCFSVVDPKYKIDNEIQDIVTIQNMQLGDILIFSLATLHRTHLSPQMTKTRFSFDLRCVTPECITPYYPGTYLLLDHDHTTINQDIKNKELVAKDAMRQAEATITAKLDPDEPAIIPNDMDASLEVTKEKAEV